MQIQTFEWKNAIPLGKSEIERDLIGVKAGSINNVSGSELSLRGFYSALGSFEVALAPNDRYTLAPGILFHRLNDLARIAGRGCRRKNRPLESFHPGLD